MNIKWYDINIQPYIFYLITYFFVSAIHNKEIIYIFTLDN